MGEDDGDGRGGQGRGGRGSRSGIFVGGGADTEAGAWVVFVLAQGIARGAPVYVTQAARRELGATPVPRRHLEPARLFSAETAREILTVMVRANSARSDS